MGRILYAWEVGDHSGHVVPFLPLLARLKALRLIFCCGQGAWEERMLVETHSLEQILRDKSIPAWVDYWGGDVAHDWPWWHKQLVYFFARWLDDDLMHRLD